MAVNRRTLWLGLALVAVLVVAGVVWISGGAGTVPGAGTPPRAPARGQAANAEAAGEQAPDHVELETLNVQRGEPGDATRNPFRFGARAPAPPAGGFTPQQPVNQTALAPLVPTVPAGPPPPPPIPLKFIGVVEQGGKRIAVLSDGRSTPSGAEGAIILGQYRILKIGAESIEMAYLDGRGRQTIRLTGQ